MSARHARGMTLIELVLAIVVVSVGLAGVLVAFNTVVGRSADPLAQKQMLAIAEQMMEEIGLQPYEAAPNTTTAFNACARNAFNDIRDYDGYATTAGHCDMDGTPVANLAAYNVRVAVNTAATLQGLGAGKVAEITVTVSHGASQSFSLTGWRTGYAVGLP